MGVVCCTISLLGLALFIYSQTVVFPLYNIFGIGFCVSYGTPAVYWLLDRSEPKYKYKLRFAQTYLWLTSIWWLVLILFLAGIIFALSAWGSTPPPGSSYRFAGITLGLWSIKVFPTYFYVYKRLKAYADSQ